VLAQRGKTLAATRGQEAMVAHLDESPGQDVLQKAARELQRGQDAGCRRQEGRGLGFSWRLCGFALEMVAPTVSPHE
jgi:hypothetical protein